MFKAAGLHIFCRYIFVHLHFISLYLLCIYLQIKTSFLLLQITSLWLWQTACNSDKEGLYKLRATPSYSLHEAFQLHTFWVYFWCRPCDGGLIVIGGVCWPGKLRQCQNSQWVLIKMQRRRSWWMPQAEKLFQSRRKLHDNANPKPVHEKSLTLDSKISSCKHRKQEKHSDRRRNQLQLLHWQQLRFIFTTTLWGKDLKYSHHTGLNYTKKKLVSVVVSSSMWVTIMPTVSTATSF